MEKLIAIIQKLKSDQYAAITVFDQLHPVRPIENNATGEILIAKYGSIENFFEDLNKKGIKNVTVIVKRKNGSTFKDDPKNPSFQMSFEAKAEAQSIPNVPANNQPMNWLAGGLQQADAIYKMMDHNRLVQECETMKAKNEILEKDNKELREKVLRNEISSGNSQANAELIKTLAPLLMPVVSKLVATPDVPGLNQPQNQSPVKQNFLLALNQMDDDTVSFLVQVMQHFGNENYVKELDALMNKYSSNGGN